MAGGRLVVNEHWGKPNQEWAGGYWWENLQLKRKPMTAGWKGKKATPWKPAHELIQISVPAHIKDGFRLHCGHTDFGTWAKSASLPEFERVARLVFDKLFTSQAADEAHNLPDNEHDTTFENQLYQNRDSLLYIEFISAIKQGDIGRVVNVLRLWMVMMRSTGTMPKYADAIFESLARVNTYEPRLKYVSCTLTVAFQLDSHHC
jgi:hypothetical protein